MPSSQLSVGVTYRLDGTGNSTTTAARVDHNHDSSYAAAGHTHVGSGGTPGGTDTQVQFNDSAAFAGDAGLTYDKNLDLLKTGLLGGKVTSAGSISSVWAPPLGDGASTIVASTKGDFTLNIPTGASIGDGTESYLHLVIANNATSAKYITFDIGTDADQYAVLHKRPCHAIMNGYSNELFLRFYNGRWYLVGPQPAIYPISFQVYGVPDANSVLFGMYIHNNGLPGGMWVPYKLDDIGNVTCGTAPTANTTFSVQRSPNGQQPWVEIGTVTFSANEKDWSTWSFPSGIVRFDHGDRMRIVAPANLNGLADLTFIMACLA